MAQIFSAAGYETAGFHSNPFLADGTGFERGFDLFEDNQTTSWKFETMLRSRVQKYTEGTAVYRGLRKLYLRLRSATSTNIGLPYKPANELVEQVIGWSQSTSEPFFCWCHFMDPHAPYQPHQGTASHDITAKKALNLYERMNLTRTSSEFTEEELQQLTDLYKGEIEYTDRYIGKLIENIRSVSSDEDLLVTLVSDHGEEFGEFGKMGHGHRFYDQNIHIPCLFSRKHVLSGIDSVDTVCSTVDILPTIANIASVESRGTDGQIIGKSSQSNNYDRYIYSHGINNRIMITDGKYKIIKSLKNQGYMIRARQNPNLEITRKSVSRSGLNISEAHLEQIVTKLDDYIETSNIKQNIKLNENLPTHVKDQLSALGYEE